jgi:hypothetical protein
MDVLGYSCAAVVAFWLGWAVKTLRDLAARQRATLSGVTA